VTGALESPAGTVATAAPVVTAAAAAAVAASQHVSPQQLKHISEALSVLASDRYWRLLLLLFLFF
jgi:hypothetical protein